MTTVYDDIESVLAASVLACALGYPTQFPNQPPLPKPADMAPWCQVFHLDGDAEPVTLGSAGDDSFSGILQIDFNCAINTGTALARQFKNKVAGHYVAGLPLSLGVFKGYVRRCYFNPGRVVDGYWRVSASIVWEGRAPRRPF